MVQFNIGWFEALLIAACFVAVAYILGEVIRDHLEHRHERELHQMRMNAELERQLFHDDTPDLSPDSSEPSTDPVTDDPDVPADDD